MKQWGERTLTSFVAEVGPHSTTLAETMLRTPVTKLGTGYKTEIRSPFFWSTIIDKGRGTVVPKRGKRLVWFRDPLREDPRIAGGYHKTFSQADNTKLNIGKEAFKSLRASGRIIVAKKSGPVPPSNFVQRAARHSKEHAETAMRNQLRDKIVSELSKLNGTFHIKVRA